jgi:phage terminase large subunit
MQLNASFPPILIPSLFADPPPRYRVYYGGRSSGKSWSVARMLLLQGLHKPLRVLCVRETMSAIGSSVHKTISDQIALLGLRNYYRVEKSGIFGIHTRTEFRFAGIRTDPDAIRSFEGCDITYCEESHHISRKSWTVLEATVIRKPGSCMIINFNPELASDETYQRWIVNPPPGTVITKINYLDNPFLSEESLDQAEHMKSVDPDLYQNVWLGFPKVHLENAIYGKQLRLAEEEHRLTNVAYDPSTPVNTAWDLGRRDMTAIIFFQKIGMEYRIIDYIQDSGRTISDYLKELQVKPYVYGTDYLPFDAQAKTLGTNLSIQEQMRAHGRTVSIVPRLSLADGIEATRTIFNRLWIDEKRCADLIQCLRKYRYELVMGKNDELVAKEVPLHDEYSHGADAARHMAISLRTPRPKSDFDHSHQGDRYQRFQSGQSWMASI